MKQQQSGPFDHLSHTARSHFLLNVYAAVYRLVFTMHALADDAQDGLQAAFEAFPFLTGYFEELVRFLPKEATWDEGWRWWRAGMEGWEGGSDADLPLLRLADQAGMSLEARLALILAGLVEEDSRFGAVFAALQAPLTLRRPSVELVGRVILGASRDALGQDAWGLCQELLGLGLVEATNPEAPRSEWALRTPAPVWDAIRGDLPGATGNGWRYQPPEDFPLVDDLILPDGFRERLAQAPAVLRSGKAGALILRGTPGSDRALLAGAMARALGMGVVAVAGQRPGETGQPATQALGPLCTMLNALPVLSYELAPGETVETPELLAYGGPVAFLLGQEGGLIGETAETALTLRLPLLEADLRLVCWQRALAPAAPGEPIVDLPAIAERYHLPDGHIRRAASLATAYAALEGRGQVTLADAQEACRALNRQMLDTLATHLPGDGCTWDTLIVSDGVAGRLLELERRCRHRERLNRYLGRGFHSAQNRGVRALFTGPSGTGKTLAARILANELGMDLYRVDLAAVVNKYIGETEKNLQRVLATAEDLDVVLLLDEGDALLGNRTEVRSANDRYANLETNYLLQRLEHYQGIVLITTNAAENIDGAFQRRMDVVVNFMAPQAEERWHIWQLHLPEGSRVGAAALERIAARCAMNGGQIRNAAQLATLLALDTPAAVVTDDLLEQAVQSEYRKAGATSPLAVRSNGHGRRSGVSALVDALS